MKTYNEFRNYLEALSKSLGKVRIVVNVQLDTELFENPNRVAEFAFIDGVWCWYDDVLESEWLPMDEFNWDDFLGFEVLEIRPYKEIKELAI